MNGGDSSHQAGRDLEETLGATSSGGVQISLGGARGSGDGSRSGGQGRGGHDHASHGGRPARSSVTAPRVTTKTNSHHAGGGRRDSIRDIEVSGLGEDTGLLASGRGDAHEVDAPLAPKREVARRSADLDGLARRSLLSDEDLGLGEVL